MFDIHGKKVLLTGATGGIGRGIVKLIHELGGVIAISGSRQEALSEITEEFGENIYSIQADFSQQAQVEELVSKAQDKMGGLDILICNAGITDDKLTLRMSNASWQRVIDINLTSTFILNRNAARIMLKNRQGRIINISSVVASTGNPGQANYVASKSGMIGLTKTIAQELAGKNITANCIAPGFITSPMTDKLTDAQKENIIKNIPMGEIGKPEDISAAVVFLMSDEARYITGHTLHVNGGMYTN